MRRAISWCLASAVVVAVSGLARADEQADLKAIVDKAIKAHGGEEKLSKIKVVSTKAKVKAFALSAFGERGYDPTGVDFLAETSWEMPDKMREEIHVTFMGKKTIINVVNGDEGWISKMGKTTAMAKDALQEAKEKIHCKRVEMLYPLKDEKEFKLSAVASSRVGENDAVGIKVSSKGHGDISLFFDKKSGLLLKTQTKAKDLFNDKKEVTEEFLYSDYKEVDGIKRAYKVTITRGGGDFAIANSSEVSVVDKPDAKLFDKP